MISTFSTGRGSSPGLRRASAQTDVPSEVTGLFTIIWGDKQAGSADAVRYALTDDSGQTIILALDEAHAQSLGGVLSFNRKYVSVQGVFAEAAAEAAQDGLPVLQVTSILPSSSPRAVLSGDELAVTGSKPWVTIMCKFSDFAVAPKSLSYFQGMYSNTKPGLDHFWRELSYNNVNVAGSSAAGWFVLPHSEAYYNPTDTEKGANLEALATDCIAAADRSVNFSLYSGINMMFNTDFDNGWAWGGSRTMFLDGVTRVWSVTWEPPWAYADGSVIAHEMGHGFGLPHSSGNYGQVYDNAWDVMSMDRYNCQDAASPYRDATYGCMAQHTISWHKSMLGWIPSAQIYTSSASGTITMERLALPTTFSYRMALIKIPGYNNTRYYTVEVRQRVGYDAKVGGDAVVIHEVDTTRTIPARVIDKDNNGDTSDAGAMWTVGETFTDAWEGISIKVVAATPTGFKVQISQPTPAPIAPVGTITSTTPTFTWSVVSGATQYSYIVYNGVNQVLTRTVNSSVCVFSCSDIPPTVLSTGAYTWRVRAYVNNVWRLYSSAKSFVVSAPSFSSSFNGNSTGWSSVYGAWGIDSSMYYYTNGITNYFSSAKHTGNFGSFTYTVRMKRNGTSATASNPNYLVIRGNPLGLTANKIWNNSYMFGFSNDGKVGVVKMLSGASTTLMPWTVSAAVVKNDWNTLKVVAVGTSLRFYINDVLVYSGYDGTHVAGQVGIMMYQNGAMGPANALYVDWAYLSVTTGAGATSASLDEQVEPGVEVVAAYKNSYSH